MPLSGKQRSICYKGPRLSNNKHKYTLFQYNDTLRHGLYHHPHTLLLPWYPNTLYTPNHFFFPSHWYRETVIALTSQKWLTKIATSFTSSKTTITKHISDFVGYWNNFKRYNRCRESNECSSRSRSSRVVVMTSMTIARTKLRKLDRKTKWSLVLWIPTQLYTKVSVYRCWRSSSCIILRLVDSKGSC